MQRPMPFYLRLRWRMLLNWGNWLHSRLQNLFGWFDIYTKFYNTGKTKNHLVRYIPGFTKPAHQGQIDGTLTKKAYADDTYKGLKVGEFNIKLTNNQYMNFHNVYLVFPMKIKKSSDVANNLANDVITVNNFWHIG